MRTNTFHRESGGLGRVCLPRRSDSEIRPAIGAKRLDSGQVLAATARSVLAGVAIPTAHKLTIETVDGPLVISVDPNGTPLERLAHGCFQAALEAGLARYLTLLEALEQGQPVAG